MTLEEILLRYTRGEAGLDATNRALEAAGTGLTLDPARNALSAQELAETTVGDTPDQANGWGLMAHGFSTLEKVRVENGHTLNVDMGSELAYVFMGGKQYTLVGTRLTEG